MFPTTTPAVPGALQAPARQRSTGHRILVTLALLAALLAGTTMASTPARADGYDYWGTDTYMFWDGTGSAVYTQGNIDWYSGGAFDTIVRGQVRDDRSGYAVLNKTGCLWVKITWGGFRVNASWPPSASGSTTSDGYYTVCGAKGTAAWLGGLHHAERFLSSATVCIGYSNNSSPDVRRYEACHKMRA